MEILILLSLILLNGVFSMSEIALVSSRKSRLEAQAKQGNASARAALALAESPGRFLSTVQVGITLIGILTGIYSGDSLTGPIEAWLLEIQPLRLYAHTIAVGLVVVIITYFSVVVGELLPKQIGLTNPEGIAKTMAAPMNLLSRLVSPFIWVLTQSSGFFIRVFGIRPSEDNQVTEEEIKSLVEEGASGGAIQEIEHDLVKNVFGLGDRRIASLMANRLEVTWLDTEEELEVNLQKVLSHKHSAYPVCRGSIDQVLGVLYIKDLLHVDLRGQLSRMEELMKEALFLTENSKAYFVLEKFKETRTYLGLVVDEYGGVAGLVTINDILDALVGDLSLEQDANEQIVARPDGTYLIDAGMDFVEFADYFAIPQAERKKLTGFNTMGGFVLHILHSLPKTGETFSWHGYRFEIIDMDKARIDKLLFTPRKPEMDHEVT